MNETQRASGHYLKSYILSIITFPCLFICMSEQFTWIDIPDLDSVILITELLYSSGPFPPIGKFLPGQWWIEFRQKILCAPHSGTYSYRVFHGRVSENKGILQECFSCYMQMNASVWKSQYWSYNPCIASVMHLFCDAHSAASNEKFKMTTPATDALLRPRLEADAGATAQRDCTTREWHQWSLRWHSIAAKCIGDFLYRLWTSDSPEKRSIELRAEVRWVRRPPKRTQLPLRSACLRTGTPWNLTVMRSSAVPYATMRHLTEAKHSVCTACLSSLIWYVVDRSATWVY